MFLGQLADAVSVSAVFIAMFELRYGMYLDESIVKHGCLACGCLYIAISQGSIKN